LICRVEWLVCRVACCWAAAAGMVSCLQMVLAASLFLAGAQQNDVAQMQPQMCWCGGFDVRAASFNGRLWLGGGYHGARDIDDVAIFGGTGAVCGSDGSEFSSDLQHNDGYVWAAVTRPPLPWVGRNAFGFFACNSKLWIIAGVAATGPLEDVWSSVDGHDWVEVTSAAAFGAREGFGAVCINGGLIVLGGFSGTSGLLLNDVWQSASFLTAQGVSWSQINTAAPWTGRRDFAATVLDSKIWLMGGYDGAPQADVWSSADDGSTWQQVSSSAAFGPVVGAGGVAFASRLWLVGGYQFRSRSSFQPQLHQRHWSPQGTVVEVHYASRRLALTDLQLEGGNGDPVIVSDVRAGGAAAAQGVKATNRLATVTLGGVPQNISVIEASLGGGIDALPFGSLVLGFSDPDTADPTQGIVPQQWYIEYEAPYPVSVWSSADGVDWTLESQHDWPGKAGCIDGFGVAVEESGPSQHERRLVIMNAAGDRLYEAAPVYYAPEEIFS